MALNYDALKATVGRAARRGELVLHTAQGMLIADAALMKDDAVIYIAGNEPSAPSPDIPSLPSPLSQEGEVHDVPPTPYSPGADTERETGFVETGARANQAVANLDGFMAKRNYAASDIADITITAVGEPALNYLAGVFTGVDAEFTYRSAGNGYEVQITASDADYARDRNYWARFKVLGWDTCDSSLMQ